MIQDDLYSVFLSGNGPFVKILREALTRDKVKRDKELESNQKKELCLVQLNQRFKMCTTFETIALLI